MGMRRYPSKFQRRMAGQQEYLDLCRAAKREFDDYISEIHHAWFLAGQHPVLLPILKQHLEQMFPGAGLAQLLSGHDDDDHEE